MNRRSSKFISDIRNHPANHLFRVEWNEVVLLAIGAPIDLIADLATIAAQCSRIKKIS